MEEEDFTKLDLGDRSWKARQSGYEELAKLFRQSEQSDPIFKQYAHVLKSTVSDANQIALESGLSAIYEYVMVMSDGALKTQIVPGIIDKCLASTRAGTRSKALDILLVLVELDGPDYVIEKLIASLDHKTPKNVASSTTVMKEILNQFGLNGFPIKPVVKCLPKLFDHRDKNVRQEAQTLTVELYRWIGTAFMASLNELKPVQLKELNAIFEQLPSEKAVPVRFRRGEVPAQKSQDEEEQTVIEDEVKVPDVYDLSDPVSFIDKIPKSFYSDVMSTKWKERKECLEQLLGLVNHPKLEDGKYFELINILAKRLQDPNVIVLVLAIDILDKMGLGLKSSFSQYKGILLTPLLERTKEKKQNVLDSLRKTLDTLFASINRVSDVIEDISSFVGHANPNVRKEAIDFLVRCLLKPRVNAELSKPELKLISEKLLKSIEDSAPEVRDVSASAFAALIKKCSERTMSVYTERLEKSKLQKVMDLVKASPGGPEKQKEMNRSSSSVISKASSPKPKPKVTSTAAKSVGKPVAKSSSAKPKSATTSRQNSSASIAIEEQPLRFEFSDDGAVDYVQNLFSEEELKDLSEGNWKLRLAAIHAFAAKLKDLNVKPEAILRYLIKTISWKENNFQIMTVFVNIIQALASVEKGFNNACGTLVVGGLVDKLGDMKIKKVAGNCLDAIVECCSVELVLSNAYGPIKAMKSPKIIADSLLWMVQTLKDFGIKGVNVKNLIDFVKTHFDSAAAPVRGNAGSIIVALYQLGKPEVRNLVNDAPSGVLSSLDAEIAKAGEQKIVPSKNQNTAAIASAVEEPLIPKADLATKVSSELIQKLGDANWKERKAALEELASIVDQSHGGIQPNLPSDLITSLKARITDSNKNLCVAAVDICGNIAKAMGKPFERYVKTFIGPALSLLADQKQTVRTVVITNLEKIVAAVGLGYILQNIAVTLAQDQPQIRKDLLKWLSEKKDELISEGSELNCLVSPIFVCLQDRNSEVRKLAQSNLGIIGEVIDSNVLKTKASDSYHGAQLASIMPFLEALGDVKVVEKQKPVQKALAPRSPQEQKKLKASKPVGIKKEQSSSESLPADVGPLLSLDIKGKDQRAAQDRGVLKWVFDNPRRELVDLLSEQCLATFNPDLHALLFSTNHYKEKDNLTGLKMLDSFFTDSNDIDQATYLQIVTSNADLVLKYLTIRFCDTNTSIFIKCLDLLEHFLQLLDEAGYLLNEYEASSFLPFFINKMGDPKETMRIKLRSIIKQIGRVYPVSKLFVYLMKGLDTKNSRTRAECLDELASLVQRNGQGVFVPSKCVGLFASQVGDRDASVRNSALNLICQIHSVLGDDITQYFSKLSEKEKDLINERLKRLPAGNQKAAAVGPSRIQPKKLPLPSRGSTPVKERVQDSRPLSPGLPVVKQFALDFDKLDMMIPTSSNQQSSTTVPKKSLSGLSSMNSAASLSSVDEGLEARIGIIVQQIASPDMDTNLEGARHLEKLLNAHPNNDIVRTNDIVGVIVSVSQSAFSNLNTMDPLNLRLCKLYTAILVQVFSSKESSNYVPYPSMEDCARKVITYLVDPELQNLDATKSLPRALNMLLVKMIDNCETNKTFRCLIHLLKESILEEQLMAQQSATHSKYTDLTMKCLWKVTKLVPGFLKDGSIRVDELLSDINGFLTDLPPPFWKRRTAEAKNSQADMPLRTIKTIMHELVNGLEENVMQYTYIFTHEPDNHVMSYLNHMLLSLKRKRGLLQERSDNVPERPVTNEMPKLQDDLEDIFSQISDKDQTKVGIQRLYDLRKQYPQIQSLIDQKLSTSGAFFQGYVRRSLANLSQEDVKAAPKPEITVPSSTDYSQALKNLQKRFHNEEEDIQPVEAVEDNTENIQNNRESRSLAVKELKERLARMKMNMTTQ